MRGDIVDKSIFYNFDKTLSHNKLFNWIIGARGIGKTFNSLETAVRRYKKGKGQFIYLRRYKEEIKPNKMENLFLPLEREGAVERVTYNAGCFYLGDDIEPCGYAFALSSTEKSMALPDVSLIIFDEFLIEKGYKRYLDDEVDAFLNFYETVARMRDVTVLFLSNAVSFYNPYFVYFDLTTPFNSDIRKKGEHLIHLVSSEKFSDVKKKTRFYSVIDNTRYAEYSVENKPLYDYNKKQVGRKTNRAINMFNIKVESGIYGFWANFADQLFYISNNYNENVVTYTLHTSVHDNDDILLKGSNYHMKLFKDVFYKGLLYFESTKIQMVFSDIVKKF